MHWPPFGLNLTNTLGKHLGSILPVQGQEGGGVVLVVSFHNGH